MIVSDLLQPRNRQVAKRGLFVTELFTDQSGAIAGHRDTRVGHAGSDRGAQLSWGRYQVEARAALVVVEDVSARPCCHSCTTTNGVLSTQQSEQVGTSATLEIMIKRASERRRATASGSAGRVGRGTDASMPPCPPDCLAETGLQHRYAHATTPRRRRSPPAAPGLA